MRTPMLIMLSLIFSLSLGAQPVTKTDEAQQILATAQTRGRQVSEAWRAHLAAGKVPKDFQPGLAEPIRELEACLVHEKRPEVRRALLVSRYAYCVLARTPRETAFLQQIMAEVPATAPEWSLQADLLASFADEDLPACQAYAQEAMARHGDPEIRKNLLFAYFWTQLDEQQESAWRAAYNTLLKEFPNSKQTQKAKEILAAELNIAVGKPAPAIAIPALDVPGKIYTLEDFAGQYLLVDFWATWCPPCRAEMPHLHAVWQRFQEKKLRILSLSFDRRAEHIALFRRQAATPMPWDHAFVAGGFDSALAQTYGVKGIPKPLLIGPDGIILAIGSSLRGENLEQTLAKVLK